MADDVWQCDLRTAMRILGLAGDKYVTKGPDHLLRVVFTAAIMTTDTVRDAKEQMALGLNNRKHKRSDEGLMIS